MVSPKLEGVDDRRRLAVFDVHAHFRAGFVQELVKAGVRSFGGGEVVGMVRCGESVGCEELMVDVMRVGLWAVVGFGIFRFVVKERVELAAEEVERGDALLGRMVEEDLLIGVFVCCEGAFSFEQ